MDSLPVRVLRSLRGFEELLGRVDAAEAATAEALKALAAFAAEVRAPAVRGARVSGCRLSRPIYVGQRPRENNHERPALVDDLGGQENCGNWHGSIPLPKMGAKNEHPNISQQQSCSVVELVGEFTRQST